MHLPRPLVEGHFVERLNRFAVAVAVGGETFRAHLPNSGRLRELLVPGAPVLLAPRPGPGRSTPYDLALVRQGTEWVSVDARLPNRLFWEALEEGRLSAWRGARVLQAEVRHGGSRLDFLVEGPEPGVRTWVEVKSVTLVQEGYGLFPDAVTARGTRHLEELAAALAQGDRAAVVFVVQQGDARAFRPHWEADPLFARRLAEVAEKGVQVLAYRCQVSPEEVRLAEPLPVRLKGLGVGSAQGEV
jgi:sugar fermentation stimulation protein A